MGARFAALWLFVSVGFGSDLVPGRYIVELDAAPAMRVEARRTAVRTQQQGLRRRLDARRIPVAATVEHVANALLVRMSEEEAAEVAAMPGVKRVHPVRRHRLFMDQASLLHRVPEAWRIAGERQGGAGVKIGILDTGIDPAHPAFDGAGMATPPGYPKVDKEEHLAFTNNKIIAVRSYAHLFEVREQDGTPRDHVGHGTATAMVAAGVASKGPLATVGGVAPRAWLGVYRIFGSSGVNDGAPSDLILKAIDDAVADGMDILNLSFGSVIATTLEADIEVDAVERATAAGVLVVLAAGNNGGDLATVGSPATAPSGLTVGAVENGREFAAPVTAGSARYKSTPGSGPKAELPIAAPFRDAALRDGEGLLCDPAPSDILAHRIVLIARGVCTFEVKLSNALAGGAVGAVVYTSEDRPVVSMSVGSATLPAVMLSYADGLALKAQLAEQPDLAGEIDFGLRPFERAPYAIADFTSKGPSIGGAIKPDLSAVGGNLYMATQREFAEGDMYDASGYLVSDGTSFSAPLVAGMAALVKAAKPGLTPADYRSLLISSAMPLPEGIQAAGAGSVDGESAMYSRLTFAPATLSFGSGDGNPDRTRTIRVRNVSAERVEYVVGVAPQSDQPAPVATPERLTLEPGASAEVTVRFRRQGLAEGPYQGYIAFADPITTHTQRVPYWYAAESATPERITVLYQETSGRSGSLLRDLILFRVTDVSGVDVAGADPAASVESGTGSVVSVVPFSRLVPGVYSLSGRLSRGLNVFRITAKGISRDVSVTGN